MILLICGSKTYKKLANITKRKQTHRIENEPVVTSGKREEDRIGIED